MFGIIRFCRARGGDDLSPKLPAITRTRLKTIVNLLATYQADSEQTRPRSPATQHLSLELSVRQRARSADFGQMENLSPDVHWSPSREPN